MFPPVEMADDDGLLCYGGELSVPILLEAYSNGIFPWPHEGYPLLWFAPPQRGIIFCEEFHLSKRTRRAIRSAGYTFKIDTNFAAVVQGCADQRQNAEGTWITPEVQAAYNELHSLGIAHSVETYQGEELVGGLYGVSIGSFFGGESMFNRTDNAAKAALGFLVEYLQERGVEWLDCQLMNPLFEQMHAREVPRERFMEMLEEALKQPRLFDGD
jgi:leucyl/phenylalanyl-tRNA--protein transferase